MPFNEEGKPCGSGFKGYPDKPNRIKRDMLNMLSLLFNQSRDTLRKDVKRKWYDVSTYDDVCKYIKSRVKDLIVF